MARHINNLIELLMRLFFLSFFSYSVYIIDVIKEYGSVKNKNEKLNWDGLDSKNILSKDGNYKYVLTANDAAGNSTKIESPHFALDTSKTELILTVSPAAFNPASASVKFVPVVKSGEVEHYSLKNHDAKI